MISSALIFQQITEAMDANVAKFKTEIQEVWSKKTEGPLCKLGAILSNGIIQTGGRTSVVTLSSKSNSLKLGACTGMLLFTHYWYWFSSINFLSLTLSPSALIAADRDLDIP
jgi:26S proteasome regulatory subunit N2